MQVKETIMTSAMLQLPLSMSRREKQQRVKDIIDQLVSISLQRIFDYGKILQINRGGETLLGSECRMKIWSQDIHEAMYTSSVLCSAKRVFG